MLIAATELFWNVFDVSVELLVCNRTPDVDEFRTILFVSAIGTDAISAAGLLAPP